MKLLAILRTSSKVGRLYSPLLLMFKLTTCFFLIATLQANAKAFSQKITLKGKNLPVRKIFDEIKEQTGYAFVYDPALLRNAKPVSLEVKDMPLREALENCFKDQPFTYEIKYQVIVLKEKPALPAHQQVLQYTPPPVQTINGTVMDEKGKPVENAGVLLKPGSRGASSDAKGAFAIRNVEQGDYTLLVSYVGYKPYDKKISVYGEAVNVDIVLEPAVNTLNETIVIGYGNVKKADLTGAVSSVSSEKITQVKAVSNIAQALQGQAAGVQVNQASGQPGESVVIKIRGTNSINASNAPLYVVDGLPLDALSAQLNPDDVERMEVLKDASSTAIYGSRGANGVVLITTKKGREGKTSVSYNGYFGVQTLRKKLKLVNAPEFAQLQNEAAANDGNAAPWTSAQIDSLQGKGTDWQDEVYRPANVQNHDLAVSGGSAITKYYTSFGYYNQGGIIRNSNFTRLSFRGNLNQQITSKLSLNTSLSIQNAKYVQAVYASADGGGGIPFTTMVLPPTQGVYDAAGNYTKFTGVSYGETNPVGISKELYNPTNTLRIIGNTGVVYDIGAGFKLKLNAGIDVNYNKADYYAPNTISIGLPDGKASKTYSNSSSFITENLLTYNKNFNSHTIDAVAGVTYQDSKSENLNSGTGIGFISNAYQNNNIQSATTLARPSTGYSDFKLVSYLSRLNYNYAGKYFVTFTGRYDGSSKFGEENKFAFFPSGALAWRVSQEDFMKEIAAVSNLKIRASYGLSGNQAIKPYQTLPSLGNVTVNFNNQTNVGYVQSSLDNKSLKWETTRQFDLGFDLGLFNERVQLTADYYSKRTNDLLLAVSLPPSSGYNTVIQNIGAVQNRGYEFQLTTNNTTGRVKWSSVLSFTHNQNRVLNLGNDATGAPITYKEIGTGGNWFPMQVGLGMNELYGYQVTGIYQTDEEAVKNGESTKRAGDYKFWDRNGNGVVDGDDRLALTHLQPKFTFGFNNTIAWKNLDVSLLFVGSYGNDIVNEFRKYNVAMTGNWTPTQAAFDQRWRGSGTSNTFDKPSVNSAQSILNYANSKWVENGSYLKLRDITVGYSFTPAALRSLKVAAVRVYVSAQNFITLTKYSGYDPEAAWSVASVNGWDRGVYPSMKSITGGVKVNF